MNCAAVLFTLMLTSGLCRDLCQAAKAESCPREDAVSLVQMQSTQVKRQPDKKHDGFVFLNMPFNFGDTVSAEAMFDSSAWARNDYIDFEIEMGHGHLETSQPYPWAKIWPNVKPGGFVWGHFNPDLQAKSEVTGCPLYLTPPKHWPKEVAQKYVANNKTILSIVRDPYEKLVAQFRGHMKSYGGSAGANSADFKQCDINGGVKALLKKLKATGDMTLGDCTNIPQSEYFEGEFGFNKGVDNWRFPQSMNEAFAEYGYDFHIDHDQIIHVNACQDSWSVDFDDETRALVQELYKKDFELICKLFGHCDLSENTCLQGVHHMCPHTLFDWNPATQMYCPKPSLDVKKVNLRMRKECA